MESKDNIYLKMQILIHMSVPAYTSVCMCARPCVLRRSQQNLQIVDCIAEKTRNWGKYFGEIK